jgi:hypothetical protein
MTLFDNLKKVYSIPVKCKNCEQKFELKIPKGKTIEEFLKSEASVCSNCGCATLAKISI